MSVDYGKPLEFVGTVQLQQIAPQAKRRMVRAARLEPGLVPRSVNLFAVHSQSNRPSIRIAAREARRWRVIAASDADMEVLAALGYGGLIDARNREAVA